MLRRGAPASAGGRAACKPRAARPCLRASRSLRCATAGAAAPNRLPEIKGVCPIAPHFGGDHNLVARQHRQAAAQHLQSTDAWGAGRMGRKAAGGRQRAEGSAAHASGRGREQAMWAGRRQVGEGEQRAVQHVPESRGLAGRSCGAEPTGSATGVPASTAGAATAAASARGGAAQQRSVHAQPSFPLPHSPTPTYPQPHPHTTAANTAATTDTTTHTHTQHPPTHRLAAGVAVKGRGVEEVDAAVKRSFDRRHALLLVYGLQQQSMCSMQVASAAQ